MSALKCKSRKVFEIPICTICLDPMQKDLVVFTQCGHVFHYNCGMNCHVNSRKCPNCRMRSTELQPLHYVVEEITGVDEQMQQLLQNLSADQKGHIPKLLADHEELLHTNQLLAQRNKFLEEKQKSITTEVEQLQKDKISLQVYIKSLEEKKHDLVNKLKSTENKRNYYENESEIHRKKFEQQSKKLLEFDYLNSIVTAIKNNQEDTFIKLIKQKPPIEQCQQMYDLYVIKVGQYKNLESELKQLQEKVEQQEKSSNNWQTKYEKLKNSMEELKKENNSIREYMKYKQDPLQKVTEDIEERTNNMLKRQPMKPIQYGQSQLRKIPLNQSMLGKK